MKIRSMYRKKAVVIHSGGMDSSLCLALAIKEFGNTDVLSLSFSYQQRHSAELKQAEKICKEWNIDHKILDLKCLRQITKNALIDNSLPICHQRSKPPNTLVTGRNGLMARLGAIHADYLGADYIYMGVMELEGSNSGYRDCSRHYMNLMEHILRIDLGNPSFEIRTPLVLMNKKETLTIAYQMGILNFLLNETISCYEGIPKFGCRMCPACLLRNEGIQLFIKDYPNFKCIYDRPF
jgi:7-cyano-7-deazaguanine synthase